MGRMKKLVMGSGGGGGGGVRERGISEGLREGICVGGETQWGVSFCWIMTCLTKKRRKETSE